jgi:hypothetical protein
MSLDFLRSAGPVLSALVALSAAASTGCVDESGTPCARLSTVSDKVSGEVHFDAPSGGFDRKSDDNLSDTRLAIEPENPNNQGENGPGPLFFVLLVRPHSTSDRGFWVRLDDIPAAPGRYDLDALRASACYCPDDAPVGDSWNCFTTTNVVGRPSCEMIHGTFTIASLEAKCASQGEMIPDGESCAMSFDVSMNVPQSAGRVYFDVHAKRTDKIEQSTCGGGWTLPFGAPVPAT